MVRRPPGTSSAARFFDAETGDRLENPIVPDPEGTEREYTGQIVYAHESLPLGGTDARLKVFKAWNKKPERSNGGLWTSVTELHEDDHHLVPWATLHTRRSLAGKAANKKIAIQEEISAAEVKRRAKELDYVAKHGRCAVCGIKPGDIWPFGTKNEVVSARCFFVDHTDKDKPTWIRDDDDMEDDLLAGDAQILCFFHNDMKTNGVDGQGSSFTHTNREVNKRNREEKGHLLAASFTDEKLELGLRMSAAKHANKRKDARASR